MNNIEGFKTNNLSIFGIVIVHIENIISTHLFEFKVGVLFTFLNKEVIVNNKKYFFIIHSL